MMALVSQLFTRFGLLLVPVVAVAFSGCAATGPVAELTFGSDYRGTESTSVTLSGSYRLEVECANGGDLQVAVLVDQKTIQKFTMACESKAVQKFDVAPPVTGTVQFTVDGQGEGTARLFEDR
ncbi:MAG: hypothetical protein VB093_00790 [Propionicimonas sp.]|nr:hypothetical protein [Propionicimonas sp.]